MFCFQVSEPAKAAVMLKLVSRTTMLSLVDHDECRNFRNINVELYTATECIGSNKPNYKVSHNRIYC